MQNFSLSLESSGLGLGLGLYPVALLISLNFIAVRSAVLESTPLVTLNYYIGLDK